MQDLIVCSFYFLITFSSGNIFSIYIVEKWYVLTSPGSSCRWYFCVLFLEPVDHGEQM